MAESEARRNIELLATAVGVGAVLLPLGGVVVRTVAFWSLNADSQRDIILGDTIGSLAFTGFKAVLASAAFLVGLIITFRAASLLHLRRITAPRAARIVADGDAINVDIERLQADLSAARAAADAGTLTQPEADDLEKRANAVLERSTQLKKAMEELDVSDEWKRLQAAAPHRVNKVLVALGRGPAWIPAVVGALLWLGLLVFFSDWPSTLPLFLAWVMAGIAAPMLFQRGLLLQFTGALAVAATVVMLCAVGSGLAGIIGSEYLADYTFKPDTNLPSGSYVHLAESNGLVYLQDCASHQFVAVGVASIAHINETSYRELTQGPSLWDVVVHQRTPIIGYRSEC